MEEMHLSKKPKIFYGYWIIVATFFCIFIYGGSFFYGFGLFVKPLEADFGWSRGEIMLALTIAMLVWGMASPFFGRMIDRYSARIVIFIGALTSGLGFALLGLMDNLLHLYVCWTVVGIGMAAMGPISVTTVVSNWFKKRRGTAIGIMSSGIGAGGFAMAPLIGGYLIPNFGWRTSYIVMALITWVVTIPLALLVIKTRPADMGLYPDGAEAPETVAVNQTSPSTAQGFTLKMALATPALWLISVSFLTGAFGLAGIVQNQVPHLVDIGFPVTAAAGALGGVGLGSLIGKFFFGWLCDQIPAKYAWCIAVGLQLIGITLYALTMGLSIGGWIPAMSMLTSTTFGLASYGAIFGMISFAFSIGSGVGPFIVGYLYDATGNYYWAFIASITLCAIAMITILMVRRPKSP